MIDSSKNLKIDNSSHKCMHCGELCPDEIVDDNKYFCCYGCLAVHNSINANGLDHFYQIRDGILKTAKPIKIKNNDLSYLDDPATASYFVDNNQYFQFYIEGVQCAACIWLIESLSKVHSDIVDIRLHFLDNTVKILFSSQASIAKACDFIQSFGYKLNPIKKEQDVSSFQNREAKKKLNQIAVAAVCSGNIMLMSFADYFGADLLFQKSFRWLSMALFIPILLYSAKDILKNALSSSLKLRASLDLPVSLAIVSGFLLSTISLLVDLDHVYFDSLAVTVF